MEIQEVLTQKGHDLLSQPRELHKLVTEKRNFAIKDLEYLLLKNKVLHSEAEVQKEILKEIGI